MTPSVPHGHIADQSKTDCLLVTVSNRSAHAQRTRRAAQGHLRPSMSLPTVSLPPEAERRSRRIGSSAADGRRAPSGLVCGKKRRARDPLAHCLDGAVLRPARHGADGGGLCRPCRPEAFQGWPLRWGITHGLLKGAWGISQAMLAVSVNRARQEDRQAATARRYASSRGRTVAGHDLRPAQPWSGARDRMSLNGSWAAVLTALASRPVYPR